MKVVPNAAAAGTPPDRQAALKKSTDQLQGVFVQQLYKAMRETVPEDSSFGGGSGEEMFTGLLDEHLAAETPQEWRHGIGESLYAQLRGRLGNDAAMPSPAPSTAPAAGAVAPAGDDGR